MTKRPETGGSDGEAHVYHANDNLPYSPEAQAQAEGSKKTLFIIVGVVALLVLAAVGAFFFLRQRKTNRPADLSPAHSVASSMYSSGDNDDRV